MSRRDTILLALGLLMLSLVAGTAVAQPGQPGPQGPQAPGGMPGMGPMPGGMMGGPMMYPPMMPMGPPQTPVLLVSDGVIYVAFEGKLTAFEAKTLKKLAEAVYAEGGPMPGMFVGPPGGSGQPEPRSRQNGY